MEILSVAQSYEADRMAVAGGVSSLSLMESAGLTVVDAIQARWDKCRVMILAGPGNNGGDGFVVARLLKAAKWPVELYLYGEKSALKGDGAANATRWRGKTFPLREALERLLELEADEELLVIDALFGAGLSKPLAGEVKTLAELINLKRDEGLALSVVAVDMPSGVVGDTGCIMGGRTGEVGVAVSADVTVTFCRPKPGHLLMPGRRLCGELLVGDIGIVDDVVSEIAPQTTLNDVALWGRDFPRTDVCAHKYVRGHLVVLGGAQMCGAGRLAALAARRAGAGLVSLAVQAESFSLYISTVDPGTLVLPYKGLKAFKKILHDARKSTLVIGPGLGTGGSAGKAVRDTVVAALKAQKRLVLDADALSAFQDTPISLFKAVHSAGCEVVLTPHGGEFTRLFPDLAKHQAVLGKLETAREAARRSGCVVLYKGPDTVVAAPDGRAGITTNAPQTLSTGGTGDVLAGFIGGLLAQGMPAFEAANAAAWLHGECANAFGPGLIAEDLIDELPEVLDWLCDLLD